MRSTVRTALAAATAVGLLAIPVASAGASSNVVTFTVASGTTLSATNGDAAVALDGGSDLDFLTGARTLTADLPTTTVTDERGGIAVGWDVTVSSTDWVRDNTDGLGAHTIDRENARVALDAIEIAAVIANALTNGMVITGWESQETGLADAGADLSANADLGYSLIAGTTTLGSGSFSYTPQIEMRLPANTPSGDYSGTVIQTIL